MPTVERPISEPVGMVVAAFARRGILLLPRILRLRPIDFEQGRASGIQLDGVTARFKPEGPVVLTAIVWHVDGVESVETTCAGGKDGHRLLCGCAVAMETCVSIHVCIRDHSGKYTLFADIPNNITVRRHPLFVESRELISTNEHHRAQRVGLVKIVRCAGLRS